MVYCKDWLATHQQEKSLAHIQAMSYVSSKCGEWANDRWIVRDDACAKLAEAEWYTINVIDCRPLTVDEDKLLGPEKLDASLMLAAETAKDINLLPTGISVEQEFANTKQAENLVIWGGGNLDPYVIPRTTVVELPPAQPVTRVTAVAGPVIGGLAILALILMGGK